MVLSAYYESKIFCDDIILLNYELLPSCPTIRPKEIDGLRLRSVSTDSACVHHPRTLDVTNWVSFFGVSIGMLFHSL